MLKKRRRDDDEDDMTMMMVRKQPKTTTTTKQESLFQHIPHDIIHYILSHLDYVFVVTRLSLLNKQFHSCIYERSFWRQLCENQSININSNHDIPILQQLQLTSITLTSECRGDDRIRRRVLEIVAPFLIRLTLMNHYVIPSDISFPNLIQFSCMVKDGSMQDSINVIQSLPQHTMMKIQQLSINYIPPNPTCHLLKELTFGKVNHLDRLLSLNCNTIERITYQNLDTSWMGPFEKISTESFHSFMQCSRLEYFKAKELFFHSELTFPQTIQLYHLSEIEFKVSSTFMKQFFSIHHPKLLKLTLCIYQVENDVDLTGLQPLSQLRELQFFIGAPYTVDTEFISQFLMHVNPQTLNVLGIASGSPFSLKHFTQFNKCSELRFYSPMVLPLMNPLIQQNTLTLKWLTIGFMGDFRLPLLHTAMVIKIIHLKRIELSSSSQFLLSLQDGTSREVLLSAAGYFKEFEPLRFSSDIVDVNDNDVFYLLPSPIEYIDVKVKCKMSIDEWILFTICCMNVKEFHCLNESGEFPVADLINSQPAVVEEKVNLIYQSLKYKFIHLLNHSSHRLIMSDEKRRELNHLFVNHLFSSELSFMNHRYNYPSISYLYKILANKILSN